ncbi:hypothetical protein FLX27_13095 [Agrobacterium tumefaciens]|jgi:hypothetical protein|uniref:hypothetical protein n=1 Tax=Rhizobium/Agrobacterium group TaxID=227290 RepID=UPI000EE33AEA|nr:hypothetical protein [Agrobacterium tumefaciens]TQN61123.1 hypothetical protein FLX27_13095 [Agrobacterium tumefaciens]HCD85490.1 hypothetical protein [Agrobacterium sp.]
MSRKTPSPQAAAKAPASEIISAASELALHCFANYRSEILVAPVQGVMVLGIRTAETPGLLPRVMLLNLASMADVQRLGHYDVVLGYREFCTTPRLSTLLLSFDQRAKNTGPAFAAMVEHGFTEASVAKWGDAVRWSSDVADKEWASAMEKFGMVDPFAHTSTA